MTSASTRIAALALAAALVPALAAAELRSEMNAYVVTKDASGLEQYAPADSVKPGQTIEYRIRHRNTFATPIGGVAVVGPVPDASVVNVDTLTTSAAALLEVRGDFDPDREGEEWSTLPAQRIVVLADGSRLIEEATAEDFTAIRWSLQGPLHSQEAVVNSYRVRVQ